MDNTPSISVSEIAPTEFYPIDFAAAFAGMTREELLDVPLDELNQYGSPHTSEIFYSKRDLHKWIKQK